MLESLRQDLRLAFRALAKSPLFTLTAVLSLAIGVGSTTAIFTLVNAVLLRPAPGVAAPERLVDVGRTQDGGGFDNFSYPAYADYRDRSAALSGLAALRMEPEQLSVGLGGSGGAAIARGSLVTGNYFDVLGARAFMGRFFTAAEDVPGAPQALVVVSHDYWTRRLGADPGVVGRVLTLNGMPFTVTGVTQPAFHGTSFAAPDLWLPLTASPLIGGPAASFESRGSVWLIGVGRLRDGATLAQAQAELSAIAAQMRADHPDDHEGQGVRLTAAGLFPGAMRTAVTAFLTVLFVVAGLVLLIAGVNVAGMLLARGVARRRETAVRLALGASRRRLLGQWIAESVLLFAIAGTAGVVVAQWLTSAFVGLLPRLPFTLALDASLDWRVLGFSMLVSLGAGLLAALAPGVDAMRTAVVAGLRDGGGTGRRMRLRRVLVAAQLAMSFLLLVAAGLFLRALSTARAIDPGFRLAGIEITALDFGLARLDSVAGRQVADRLLAGAAMLPGVEGAVLAADLPLDDGGMSLGRVTVPGVTDRDGGAALDADWNIVTPGYFRLMDIELRRGRDFAESDRAGGNVAIVNETLAERLWPGREAIGRTFVTEGRTYTVIGVARDARYRSLAEPRRAFVYVPYSQNYTGRVSLLVRASGDPAAVATPVRALVAAVHPALPVVDQQSLESYTAVALFPQRVALRLAGSLGVVALLLAMLGIHGVAAYTVAQRTREIGLRMALGAPRGRVLAMILRQSGLVAGSGVAVGVVAAAALAPLIAGLLYGVSAWDAAVFSAAALALLLVAIGASVGPARRAASVPPTVALRAD